MKKFMNNFKTFIMRGNVMNLAVGVIIGAAFQGVVTSLSTNILSPIIGLFAGQNFDTLTVTFLGVTLNYGAFLTAVINFLIMAFVVFILITIMERLMNLGKKTPPPAVPTRKTCPFCRSDIHIEATRCSACTSLLE